MVVDQAKYQQPTVANLIKRLINDFNNLTMQHIHLLKYEIREEISLIGRYTAIVITGALLAYTGMIFLGFFLIFLLALIVPLWTSALIVTLLFFILAVVSGLILKNKIKNLKVPTDSLSQETKRTMEESSKWLQEFK